MSLEDQPVTVADIDRAPNKLPNGSDETLSHSEYDTLLNRIGQLGQENSELREENQTLRNHKQAAEELNKLIAPYAGKAFWFMCSYSGIVAIFLFGSGAKFWGLEKFFLDTSVLEFLVGSTAITVIGLVGMVLTGIFVGARKK